MRDFPDTTAEDETLSSVEEITSYCKAYKGADTRQSLFQLVTTLALFACVIGLMLYSTGVSYGLTAILVVPAAGLLTRLFVFQHDCGHGSFFISRRANNLVGRCLGILTVTPYDFWRRAHNMHHATSGDLDRRSIGAIDTITLQEYRSLSKTRQWLYRLYRNPLVLLLFGTPLYILILQRIPYKQSSFFHDGYKSLPVSSIWKSIMGTNAALVVFYGSLAYIVGPVPLLSVYLPVLIVTAWIGGWLFFIQHQFEETYWEKNQSWNSQEAALMGSSYYVLPKILQWFTGSIGLHHIHHLCSQIPNYKLQKCMDAKPELGHINRMTIGESMKCIRLRLWDEEKGHMVDIAGK